MGSAWYRHVAALEAGFVSSVFRSFILVSGTGGPRLFPDTRGFEVGGLLGVVFGITHGS